jgi:predicted pyridoxine 5'-phosphate oxidase superfamily flavin-nucleotide-binding protein
MSTANPAPVGGPFHAGELQAQALAGKGAPGTAIRPIMPEQHRDFFASLRFMLLATLDDDGWPTATVVHGKAGFIASADERNLRVNMPPAADDPVLRLLVQGKLAGMLGIDFGTRRRNRVNGRIADVDAQGFSLAVDESFGNCPKYIVPRRLSDAPARESQATLALASLNDEARALIARSETMFIATSAGKDADRGGVDVSHRGGPVGFVTVNGDTLTVPDFTGNRYFNTLGNLLLEPRAALLFIDFSKGDLLHLQGRAEILWHVKDDSMPAAERSWRLHVERGALRRGVLPLRWQAY